MSLTLALLFALVCSAPEPPQPHPDDVLRFPPAEVCQSMIDFAAGHRAQLQARRSLESWHDTALVEQVAEADRLAAPWDQLGAAHYWRERLNRAEKVPAADQGGDNSDDGTGEDCYGGYTPEYCRDCLLGVLTRLRNLIGPEAYCAGVLPPALPLSRFVRIN